VVDGLADQFPQYLMENIGSYQAKNHLPALLDRLAIGEEFLITLQGKPAARPLPVAKVGDAQRAVEAPSGPPGPSRPAAP